MASQASSSATQQVMGPGTNSRVCFQSHRLLFDGVTENYEKWEVKFLAHLRLQGLKKVVTLSDDTAVNAEQNEEVFAELVQVLDDKSLTLIMREAVDDGRKAFKILREHYASNSTPRIIALYTELTSLSAGRDESMTDYLIRAETAVAALREAKETVSDARSPYRHGFEGFTRRLQTLHSRGNPEGEPVVPELQIYSPWLQRDGEIASSQGQR